MLLFRWMIGLPIAAAITATLFFLMSEMINNPVDIGEPKETPIIKIVADEPRPVDPKPKPKPIPKDAPETIIDFPKSTGKPDNKVPLPDPKPVVDGVPSGTGNIPSPTIRIAPPYPEGCRSKGAHGIVIVQFDVTPDGSTTNINIIQSPDRCFDRPIRKAVSQWKYPPANNNGRAAMRYGLVEKFNFQLVD